MLNFSAALKLWFCPDPVDMRLGFDGLFLLVRNRFDADPLSGHLFVFTNRRRDRVKILYWGGHGLCLWCQRLERGRYHFPLPKQGQRSVELSAAAFLAILDGALPGLFALGEEPNAEQLTQWLPDQWKQRQDAKAKAGSSG